MSYKSPIELILSDMQQRWVEQTEGHVMEAIENIGVNVDKDELIKALTYDRKQYEQGYADAMLNAVQVVKCRDCKYGTLTKNCKGEPRVSCWHPQNYIESDWLLNPDFFCADGERKEKQDG